ncbi:MULTISPECIES: hypothetical protein [Gammaproteobacteria]|uniref:hypothetical protein n=1 Tax=Gammaproteobacteria TaxID=1236 RepID=UPI000DD02CD3|nr:MULTISPECIES: hypothetical protein [Gammaproteobacteria]RTE86969.1 hypothetical protein DQX04_00845 [Aliidiomarina sp. B3213]TCZ93241.1 hypothetical protein EYQ95_04455 [Lysobacter sp. N42]
MKKALRVSFLVGLAAAFWVLFGDSYQFRFNYSPLNNLSFAALCIGVPALLVASAMTFKSDLIKLPGVTIGLLLLLGPGFAVAGFAGFIGVSNVLDP